jgi:hypothetical protein
VQRGGKPDHLVRGVAAGVEHACDQIERNLLLGARAPASGRSV